MQKEGKEGGVQAGQHVQVLPPVGVRRPLDVGPLAAGKMTPESEPLGNMDRSEAEGGVRARDL